MLPGASVDKVDELYKMARIRILKSLVGMKVLLPLVVICKQSSAGLVVSCQRRRWVLCSSISCG